MDSFRRINMKKRVCAFVFSLTLFALLSITYNELNYLSLEAKLEELRKVNSELIQKYLTLESNQEKLSISSSKKKTSYYATGPFFENFVQIDGTLKDRTTEHVTTSPDKISLEDKTTQYVTTFPKDNKFQDMHKYSKFNPNFRVHMEWPPDGAIRGKNPSVSEIKKTPIKPNMTNWMKFNLQIRKFYLYEENSTVVEDMLHDMATQKIIDIHQGEGMQFELIVTFENGARALFKPQRYPKDQEVQPNILYFSDFERHFSEIAAYHLDRILGFRRVPPTIGRKVNIIDDIYKLAFLNLSTTFFYSPDGNYCFHGSCKQYCDTHHSFCGKLDLIEGSFSTLLLSNPKEYLNRSLVRNPFKRSYDPNIIEAWEEDIYYCINTVKEEYFFYSDRRVMDTIDCAIFDYLMGNMHRPNFDELLIFGNDSSGNMLHINNGRGFGRSDHDEPSILAPLTQCCSVRLSTFNKLYSFYIGPRHLSDLMRESLAKDPLSPILTERHLKALDRRVEKVLEVIQRCIQSNVASAILHDDM